MGLVARAFDYLSMMRPEKMRPATETSCLEYRSAEHSSPRHLQPAEFVDEFLEWVARSSTEKTGWIPWATVPKLAYEFASFANVAVVSDMALSKALAGRGMERRQRYLRKGEIQFERKRDCGQRRPRVQDVRLPVPRAVILHMNRAGPVEQG